MVYDTLTIIIVAFILALILCLVEAIKGATIFDRVISIDAIVALTVGILGFLAFQYDQEIFLDIALVYAVVAFIGDLAVSKYLEGKELEE